MARAAPVPGGFEEAARLRRVRARLWRSVWVQTHAYDRWESSRANAKSAARLALEATADRVWEDAAQDQPLAVAEAEALGFSGRQAWLE